MYQWIVLLHILGAFAFFMAHGASAAMAFQLRRERDINRIRAILDLSNAALPVAYGALLLLLLAGIAAGIMGNWFVKGWIWASIAVLLVMWGVMVYYGARYYAPIRKAVGLPYRIRGDEYPAEPPASEAEIQQIIQASRPHTLTGISLAFIALLLWLMIFKPF
ncbi:MAG: hypothetical protein J0L63_15230 [Anaerolineae bacterium]|nr:hypothetical protein [Anaerolineae bacterium]